MIIFPVFTELEKKRDEINDHFHRDTEPQLVERVQQFGFVPVQPGDLQHMRLKEQSTANEYLLTFRPYEIRVEFCHVKTQEKLLICEISNFALSAHSIMNILIASIDSWLQYGVIYDYRTAQHYDEETKK